MSEELNIAHYRNIYFLGIGGIGMSALARYFKAKGLNVSGYDRTETPLTKTLEQEGIKVHFDDLGPSIPTPFNDKETTLVIYTPAIPQNLGERLFFVHSGHVMIKRAQALGLITRSSKSLGVAGTHGKTTTSAMLAHLLHNSKLKCHAFLGGISSNYNTNFISDAEAQYTVVEADEFDRSFLQLRPFSSIITTMDADHLDIYGDEHSFTQGFADYAKLISKEGVLVHHKRVHLSHSNTICYAIDQEADYVGTNLRYENGRFLFDLNTPNGFLSTIELGMPGIHNVENAIACIALCSFLGMDETTIRAGLASFQGVKRRFEYQVRTKELVYIDDYAHHPTEIQALITSVRLLYPDKEITAIFQPHLFSRTRDFFQGFVSELSKVDQLVLMPIYPAREEPIDGVNSESLLEHITVKHKALLPPNEVISEIGKLKSGVILTIGAGDIDKIVEPLKAQLKTNEKLA